MKLTAVYGAAAGYELGLDVLYKVIADTLSELGEEVGQVQLAFNEIPNFDGVKSKSAETIMQSITQSDGIIFAATTVMNAPCALFKTFLEYFSCSEFAGALKGKNCMIVTTSLNGGERATIEYLSGIIGHLGGYDAVRISAGAKEAKELAENSELREIVEKQTEDFYRILRQNRKFIIPAYQNSGDNTDADVESGSTANDDIFTDEEYLALFGKPKQSKVNLDEIYQKHNIEPANEGEKDEIEEIANYFAQKFIKTDNGVIASNIEQITNKSSKAEPAKPRSKTCRQLTQSMIHHFNPQAAAGIKAVFQLNISGPGGFDGYITIDNSECTFSEGQTAQSDIVILTDDKSWIDIVNGKFTAQKAFMVGRLKVRGNFILLTKYDTFFK